MSYLKTIDGEKFSEDIVNRREFSRYKPYKRTQTDLDQEIQNAKKLVLRSYQRFAENYMSPNSPVKKVYIKYGTGVGKTNLALNVAMRFVENFEKNREVNPQKKLPSIGIIGFTKNIFRRELLKWTEFGYVTREEIDRQKQLAFLAETGSKQDMDNYIEFMTFLRRRLTNKRRRGFFVFYGYREFSNRVIIPSQVSPDYEDSQINENDAVTGSGQKRKSKSRTNDDSDSDFNDDHETSARDIRQSKFQQEQEWWETIIGQNNKNGTFGGDEYKFANGGDEDHEFAEVADDLDNSTLKSDISNMTESEILEGIKKGSIKVNTDLFETFRHGLIICDEIHNVYNSNDKNNWGVALQLLVNYLGDDIHIMYLSATPINHSPTEIIDLGNLLTDGKLTKKDFNMDCDNFVGLSDNQQNVIINKIGKIFAGRVLFLEDADPRYYPSSKLEGEYIPGIDILKFVRCGMPALGWQTYQSFYEGTLSQDSQYIMDFILPDPTKTDQNCDTCEYIYPAFRKAGPQKGALGLFKTQEVKNAYLEANPDWLSANNIVVTEDYGFNISGEFLRADNLPNISTKYAKMLTDLKAHIKNGGGKVLIYHKYVRMSGVIFIKEILAHNGFLDEYSAPADNTLDALLGITKAEFFKSGKNKDRDFIPCRFVVIHSDIDHSTREKLIEKFNSPNNAEGQTFKIMIGADVIKESYDLKCVNLVMIMSKPDNISTLLQIFGRAKRQYSHSFLPPEKRHVTYRIYVASVPKEANAKKGLLTYEEEKYKERILDYKLIQKIEKSLNEHAVDSAINFETIQNTFVKNGELGVLNFNPKFNPRGKINKWTDLAYYNEREIIDTIYIIKRLFIEVSTVFKLSDIMSLVKEPPFSLDFDPSVIEEDNINIALFRLTTPIHEQILSNNNGSAIDKLFDPNDKIIIINGAEYCVTKVNEFFMLVPFNGQVNVMVESVYRNINKNKKIIINIGDFLSSSNTIENYEIRREKFITKYMKVIQDGTGDFIDAICDYNLEFQTRFIEEMITVIFDAIFKSELNDAKGSKDMGPSSANNHRSGLTIKNSKEYKERLIFYCHMLHYYSVHEVIIFFNMAQQYIRETYEFDCAECKTKTSILNTMEFSISNVKCKGCPNVVNSSLMQNINSLIQLVLGPNRAKTSFSRTQITNSYDKKSKSSKSSKSGSSIDGNILPIGYFMQKVPRFYHPVKGWYDAADYTRGCRNFLENDVIIGYYQKSTTGLRVLFKIRRPIHKQDNKGDSRKSEKGTACASKSKSELHELLDALGTKVTEDLSIGDLCQMLKYRLLYLEILERRNPQSNIKYFYQYWECQPISKSEIL